MIDFLVIETSGRKLTIYDLASRKTIFRENLKEYLKCIFDNDRQIITGAGDNIFLLDLETLDLKKYQIHGFGSGRYLTKYNDGFLAYHCLPEDSRPDTKNICGYEIQWFYDVADTTVSLLDSQFNITKTLFKIEGNDSLARPAHNFEFANGKLFSACGDILRVKNIATLEEQLFYYDNGLTDFARMNLAAKLIIYP